MGAETGEDCTDGHHGNHGNMGEGQPTVQGLGFTLHQLEQSEFPCGTLNELCPSQHQFEAVLMLVLRERMILRMGWSVLCKLLAF